MNIITPNGAALSPSGPVADGSPATTFEQIIPVTGDIVGVLAPFWNSNSTNVLGASYYISLYAEVYNTTLNFGCVMSVFTVSYPFNGTPTTATLANLRLDVTNYIFITAAIGIDNNQPVQWSVDVNGWASGAGTLRVRTSLIRLA